MHIPQAGKTTWPEGHNPISTKYGVRCTCDSFESDALTRPASWRQFERHCKDIKKERT